MLLIAIAFFTATSSCVSFSSSLPNPSFIEATRISEELDFCGEPVPLQDETVRERLERELIICMDNSDDIILWLKRSRRYFPYIEELLKKNNMPDDLKFIAVAESSLRTYAGSPKGAMGYWQFIESTAIKYGLTVNNDIDERRNFFLSTPAALNYLKDLYALFGSWTLAAAAYNMGEDGLKAEIIVQKVNNYYRLFLYQETQRYIFRILAIKMILSNPEKYGYKLTKDDFYQPVEFDTIKITAEQTIPITVIAEAANTYFKTIKDLNPQLRNYYLPPGNFTLHIPKGTAILFNQRLESLLSKWMNEKSERIYTVQSGDNLSSIAERFNVSVKALMIWNSLTSTSRLTAGQKIIVFPGNNNAAINVPDAAKDQ
ncbi:MAG TPA: transglycosylase SLT domain-containing protein [Smithellaceae bacterium]|nr:transglycosylase SLT domain-containing protein [Smithellaceae bacterium]HRS88946.1 transglycosylase SLT domain-containing protein [Smithellaceae bacterium]HRV25562.1 transglycosylase SLT domain-containing protein [Smithellaceae bacterium]